MPALQVNQMRAYQPRFVLEGSRHMGRLVSLGSVIEGGSAGRAQPGEVTPFCSVGLAGTEVYLLAELIRRHQPSRPSNHLVAGHHVGWPHSPRSQPSCRASWPWGLSAGDGGPLALAGTRPSALAGRDRFARAYHVAGDACFRTGRTGASVACSIIAITLLLPHTVLPRISVNEDKGCSSGRTASQSPQPWRHEPDSQSPHQHHARCGQERPSARARRERIVAQVRALLAPG